MPPDRLYLDHVASTPLLPAARAALLEALDAPGNPSSGHAEGRRAREKLEAARSRAADALGCRPREVAFTASGTVAAQIAVLGVARARKGASRRVVLSAVEHPAVGEAERPLQDEGFDVVRVPPEADGVVDAGRFLDAVGTDAALAALILANHETGIVMPVAEVAAALRERRVPFLCDACLGPGRVPCRVDDVGADLLVLSGHKFGGPRGAGLLYVRRRTRLAPVWTGGLQEERLHPGTEAVAGAVGLSVALEAALADGATRAACAAAATQALLDALAGLASWSAVGRRAALLPGVVTLELPGVEGEAAMINLDLEGVAVSTGSACAMGGTDPSPGLLAMGFSRQRAASTIRVSFGHDADETQARRAADAIQRVVTRLRGLGRP